MLLSRRETAQAWLAFLREERFFMEKTLFPLIHLIKK